MSYERPGVDTPGDQTCQYGASKLHFRGPKRPLDVPYVACIGGTETFGRFVPDPFPAVLERRLGEVCVNLGCINGGLDTVIQDPELLRMAHKADISILQLPGAHNLSNRLYRVHPRRNDRFLQASETLAGLYPEVDFTEFHFNKHLLNHLLAFGADRFSLVKRELQQAWLARMRLLVSQMDGVIALLWLRYDGQEEDVAESGMGADPWLITSDMVEKLRNDVSTIVEVSVQPAGASDELEDMIFGTMQEPAAEHMMGPATHQIVADKVYRALRDLDE
ncbi:hypothetical protein DS909_21850 [Phaeobacter gallaeciensis]|uniref:DUF6473 domain-containing protein n=2 Tax=Roseobacteraceae TaxID=2854170 RepID=A0A366WNT2_9RHOB|nr:MULTISPECIES: DUF6473 family protein [Roseobacteraceae]MBT3140219.1 hypothetical protein [Falsiruegeria litorea]MBT8169022.1 hypothetical protein [Falsiruegeria litorea]RBW50521.1 hypothetical protein DS909_21850 [Phaeobacter gallaeciensis]